MSVFHEIRKQPDHIREIFMWLSVVITTSIVGYVWIGSVSRDITALANPGQTEQRTYAQKDGKAQTTASLFGNFGQSVSGLTATISELIGVRANTSSGAKISSDSKVPPVVAPQLFPTTQDKKSQ